MRHSKSKEGGDPETLARMRAELILKVRSGLMTASEAAKQLGVSRKTYYKWENRGLEGMLDALLDRSSGRPSRPVDGEKETLESSLEQIKKQLLLAEQRAEIQTILYDDLGLIEALRRNGSKKK